MLVSGRVQFAGYFIATVDDAAAARAAATAGNAAAVAATAEANEKGDPSVNFPKDISITAVPLAGTNS